MRTNLLGPCGMIVYRLNLNRYRESWIKRVSPEHISRSGFEYPFQPFSETDRVNSRCGPEEALKLPLAGEHSRAGKFHRALGDPHPWHGAASPNR